MWRIADRSSELLINIFLVKSQLVQHADKEAILLLGVVLALVGSIGDAELVEGCPIPGNLCVQCLKTSGSLNKLQVCKTDILEFD